MNGWKEMCLSEFCRIGSGGTPSRSNLTRYYEGGKIPWVKSGELRESVITKTEEHITEAALKETNARIVPAGALLLAMYGATVGRLGILGVEAATNQAVCHIIPDPKTADTRFLFQALSNQVPNIVARGVGGAQPNISQGIIKDLKLALPPLAEQRRIAEVLDKAEALRTKRRAALAQLDSLTESLFLDLFGDPVFNKQNWSRVHLIGVCHSPDDIKCGPFGTQLSRDEFKSEGIPLWGIKNVNKLFELPTHEFLEPHTAKRLMQYSIEPGDIVMTRKGTVGNCAVYPANLPLGIMHSDLLRIRVNRESCEPIFLAHQLHHSRDVERQLALISGGAVMPGINVTSLKSLDVLVPPISLQSEFARRVTIVEKLKSTQRSSLADLDTLFSSLQQRAFSGELFQ